MKRFLILASGLLLTSSCCAMNNPPGGDNSFLLRRSAPSSTQQPGVKPPEDVDLSNMSVNSRARHMTNFVSEQLPAGQCPYEKNLLDLEKKNKSNETKKPDADHAWEKDAAVLAWERAGDDPDCEDELTSSKASSQTKHRPLDRTTSADPALQSIVVPAPAAQPQTASPSLAGPSTPDDSDDKQSNDTVTNNTSESAPAVTKKSKKQKPQDDLLFGMDDI